MTRRLVEIGQLILLNADSECLEYWNMGGPQPYWKGRAKRERELEFVFCVKVIIKYLNLFLTNLKYFWDPSSRLRTQPWHTAFRGYD